MMYVQDHVRLVTNSVCERFRKSGLDGAADILAWSATQDMQRLFLSAEWCQKAATDADLLPNKAPVTLGKAVRTATAAGMMVAIGIVKNKGKPVPTGFGMAFSLCARSAPLLIPALNPQKTLNTDFVLAYDELWGRACGAARFGAGDGGEDFLEGQSGVALHPYPRSDAEEHAFGKAVERCNAHGIPWIRTLDNLQAPSTSTATACRMLFHAVGHACQQNDVQSRLFLNATMREVAA